MTTPARDAKLQAYLDALRKGGVRGAACKQAGISYSFMLKAREDPLFAEAEEEALEEAADLLEAEAWRRAHEGVERRKFAGSGEHMIEYTETTYSDGLLTFLLKGIRPDKYADRQKSELSGPGGKAVELNDTSAAARIAALLDSAKRRKADEPEIDPLS